MSKVKRTSAYDTLQWVRSIAQAGYDKFMFRDLPEHLHINAYHRKALSKGYLTEIGKQEVEGGILLNVYTIPSDIFKIKHWTPPK